LTHHQAKVAATLSLHPTARIQTSYSSGDVRMTGIAFAWIGSTIAFGAVVRKP
jgi:hypothetical protein